MARVFTITNLSECILRVRKADNHSAKHEILPGSSAAISAHPSQFWEFHARYNVKGISLVRLSPIMLDMVISDELVKACVEITKKDVARKANPQADVNAKAAKAGAAQ